MTRRRQDARVSAQRLPTPDLPFRSRARPACTTAVVLVGLVATLLTARSLLAQERDTTGAAVARVPGLVVGDTIPALSPALDATDLLAGVPGSFVYDLGPVGWPHGWSPAGLSPQHVSLLLNGMPFDDPVTGRPRYDLLPLALLEPLVVEAARVGEPVGVLATVRPFTFEEPHTELRYRTSNTGLQSISAMHVQQRRRALFGTPGTLQVLFAYGGHAAEGEYPGSRLRRARQLMGRIRYEQATWSVELSELYNRHRVDAHGGVLPLPGAPFESIYNRFDATVRDPNQRRQTLRNDLALTARAHLLPGRTTPLTASAFWTAQTFRFGTPDDTLTTETNRFGGFAYQDMGRGTHRLRLRLEGWVDTVTRSNALLTGNRDGRAVLHASVRGQTRAAGWELSGEAGLHLTKHATFPSGTIWVHRPFGPVRLLSGASYTAQPVSPVESRGFGAYVLPVEPIPDGRVGQVAAGMSLSGGSVDLAILAFAHRITEPLDLYVAQAERDTIAALVAPSPFRRVGVSGTLSLREEADRGLYLTLQPSFVQFLDESASPLHQRAAAALPAFFGRARLGARMLLFRGDLDLDLSLRGRFWTAFRSRTLHPPTGLLVLPELGARTFSPNGTLDIVAEAGIRTATLFLAYENVLSGTVVTEGNLIVPDYPLPERRFRFGVFWPIEN